NHKPVLEDIADQKVLEGEEISFTLSATDADGDSLHFGMSGNPVGSTLSGASFSWTPSLDQVGSHAITFSVSDGKGETDTQSVNLTVERVNHDPVLAAVGRKSIQEGQTLSFALSATDTDGDELRYSVSHNPPGSTLSENVFFWTPTVGQAGFYLVTFTVSDGKGGSHSQTDTISVVEIKPPPSSIKITIDPMVPLDTSDIELQIDATFSSSSATIQNHSAAIEDSVITIALVTDQIEDEAPSAEPLWSFIERIGRLAKGNFLVVVTVNGDEFLHETLRVRGKSSDAGIVFMDFDLTEGNQNKSDTGGAEPGKEFQVQLYIKDAGLILSGWNILLKFDSDMIEYVPGSFKAGSFMPGLVCLEDIKTGEAEIGGAILGETEGVTGGGELGTLSFRVLEGFETETQIYIIENNFRFPEGGSEKYYTFSVATITEKLALIGDFNGDGVVDFNDFFAFADHFGTEAGDENYVVMYDLDGSGRVDFDDFFIFADQFRKKERAKLIALAQQYIDFPSNPILEPNYPNPFNISTTLQYRIIAPTLVHLDVFDLTGQRVKMLVNTYQSPGVHEVIWDGTNDHEKHVSTGIYLTRFQVGGFTEVRKMLLVK
ncbi:MAG: T9SS type A sorting domain-containing protein, partial [Chloroflexi bacterium]|nr:T9SS type A sorting domain-containing protein [Chloroflexota bacterium]